MKGGHASSGPAPSADALRRGRPGDAAAWIHLPADGRVGDPPAWPLTRANKREAELWAEEWRRPQAVMWEANHLEREVALYVRSLAGAEKLNATVALRTLVKQQMELLGISLPGMNRLRWVIDGQAMSSSAPRRPAVASRAKERLQGLDLEVVDGGA